MSEILTQELTIRAPAQIVYELLTDAESLAEWMAADTELQPWPGGVARWRHANGDVCRGQFVKLVPYERVVFTYGWERANVGSDRFDDSGDRPGRGGWCDDTAPHPSRTVRAGRRRA